MAYAKKTKFQRKGYGTVALKQNTVKNFKSGETFEVMEGYLNVTPKRNIKAGETILVKLSTYQDQEAVVTEFSDGKPVFLVRAEKCLATDDDFKSGKEANW